MQWPWATADLKENNLHVRLCCLILSWRDLLEKWLTNSRAVPFDQDTVCSRRFQSILEGECDWIKKLCWRTWLGDHHVMDRKHIVTVTLTLFWQWFYHVQDRPGYHVWLLCFWCFGDGKENARTISRSCPRADFKTWLIWFFFRWVFFEFSVNLPVRAIMRHSILPHCLRVDSRSFYIPGKGSTPEEGWVQFNATTVVTMICLQTPTFWSLSLKIRLLFFFSRALLLLGATLLVTLRCHLVVCPWQDTPAPLPGNMISGQLGQLFVYFWMFYAILSAQKIVHLKFFFNEMWVKQGATQCCQAF